MHDMIITPAAGTKILLVCMKYDYGNPDRGTSYEWNHFYLGLKKYFDEISFFDFFATHQSLGQKGMQDELQDKILQEKPDVTIFSLYTDQFSTEFVKVCRGLQKRSVFFMMMDGEKSFLRSGHLVLMLLPRPTSRC